MPEISKDVVALIQYLMPGFLMAWVFYAFTAHGKPVQFERVVQALIFTVFVQAALYPVRALFLWFGTYVSLGQWTASSDLITTLALGLVFGVASAYLTNSDKLHSLARRVRATTKTSYPGSGREHANVNPPPSYQKPPPPPSPPPRKP